MSYQETHFKGPRGLRTYSDPAPLGFSTRAIAGREPVAYREKVRRLEAEQVLGDSFFPSKPLEARQRHCALSGPSPNTEPQSCEMGCPTLAITSASTPYNLQVCSSIIGHSTKTGKKKALPNTQKQTQGRCQIEETKKYDPIERTEQNSKKRIK